MQKIILGEGTAILVEEIIHDIVPLEDFRRAISLNKVTTPILPFGTIYYEESGDSVKIVVVRRAEVRDLNHANVIFKVAMPHRIYTLRLRNGVVRGCKQHFALDLPGSLEAPLFQAPFPNRTDSGGLCQSGVMITANQETIAFKVDHVVNQVERTRHNTDHISYALRTMPAEFRQDNTSNYKRMLESWKSWTQEHMETWEADLHEISWQSSGQLSVILGGNDG